MAARSNHNKKGGSNADVDDMLPEIGHKFSSWAKDDQNLNELDDLLMEHDLLAQPAGGPRQNYKAAAAAAMRQHGASSPDNFDFEEVMDEFGGIEAGGGDLDDSRKNRKSNVSENKVTDESNSFDLDNSDDLNRFIQKYETMLDGDGSNKKSNSKLAAGRADS